MIPTNQYWLNNTQKSDPLANGLLWYYKFNNNGLKTFGSQDAVGYNITYDTDAEGTRANLNGSDRFYIESNSDFDLGSYDFTINFDFTPSNVTSRQFFLGNSNTIGSDYSITFVAEITAAGKILVTFLTASLTYIELTSTTTLSVGQKYIVCVTRETNTFKLYVNNLNEDTKLSGLALNSSNYKMAVGGLGEYIGIDPINLKFSAFRGWNRCLTSGELASLYNGGIGNKFNCVSSPLSSDLLQTQLIDTRATAYATFQSHNQKIVHNANGLFCTSLHSTSNPVTYTDQLWQLRQSTDNGRTWAILYSDRTYDQCPIIETDSNNNIYIATINSTATQTIFLKFDSSDYTTPSVTTNVNITLSSKMTMHIDEANNRLYYFISRGNLISLDLSLNVIINNLQILQTGATANCMYPSITIDNSGVLYFAWTTQKILGPILYYDIHWAKSSDGGSSWTKADGTSLTLPIVSDDGGPADMINTVGEIGTGIWLSSWSYVNERLHAVYWISGSKLKYVRINPSTGSIEYSNDIITVGTPPLGTAFFRNTTGTFANPTDLYIVAYDQSETMLTSFVSTDNGQTWTKYADRYKILKEYVYAAGGYREQVGNYCYGTFTTLNARSISYHENDGAYLTFFKLSI